MLTAKGGPKALDVLRVVDLPLEEPGPGQLRVRVRAAGVGSTDLLVAGGNYLFAPENPFRPRLRNCGRSGCPGTGGRGVPRRPAGRALTVYGGFGEMLVRGADHFLPIPEGVSDRDAAAVVLNFVTAYQAIHRVGKAKAGQTALVTGAAGGVGTAALQLLRLAGVKTYGAASARKHATVRALGAVPIDHGAGPLDRLIRALEPGGVDLVLDGVGGPLITPCIGALRSGGRLVAYGFMAAAPGALSTAAMFTNIFLGSRLRGRSGSFYGITSALSKGHCAVSRGPAEDLLPARGKEGGPGGHEDVSALGGAQGARAPRYGRGRGEDRARKSGRWHDAVTRSRLARRAKAQGLANLRPKQPSPTPRASPSESRAPRSSPAGTSPPPRRRGDDVALVAEHEALERAPLRIHDPVSGTPSCAYQRSFVTRS